MAHWRTVKITQAAFKLPKLEGDEVAVDVAWSARGNTSRAIVRALAKRGQKRNAAKSSSYVAAAVSCMEKALPCLLEEMKAPQLGVNELARAKAAAKALLQQVETLEEMARGRETADLMKELAKLEACSVTERCRMAAELALVKRQKQMEAECKKLLAEEVARLKDEAESSAARHRKEALQLKQDIESLTTLKREEVTRLWQEGECSAAGHREEKDGLLSRHVEVQQALRRQLEEERDKSLCLSCMDKPRDTLVLPCLHFHYCFACLLQQRTSNSNTCPTCRRDIDGLCMSSSLANH